MIPVCLVAEHMCTRRAERDDDKCEGEEKKEGKSEREGNVGGGGEPVRIQDLYRRSSESEYIHIISSYVRVGPMSGVRFASGRFRMVLRDVRDKGIRSAR